MESRNSETLRQIALKEHDSCMPVFSVLDWESLFVDAARRFHHGCSTVCPYESDASCGLTLNDTTVHWAGCEIVPMIGRMCAACL